MFSGNYDRDDRYRSRQQRRSRGAVDDRFRDDGDLESNYSNGERFSSGSPEWDGGYDRGRMPDERARGHMMDAKEYGGGPSFGERNRFGGHSQRQRGRGDETPRGNDAQTTRSADEAGYGGGYERGYDGRNEDRYDDGNDRPFGGAGFNGSDNTWTSQGDGTAYEGADYRQWSRNRGLYGSSEYGGASRENRQRSGVRQQGMRNDPATDMNRSSSIDSQRGQSASSFSGKGPKGWTRSDDRIREDVSEALARHSEIDASEIEVEVKNGELTLSGTVTEKYAKRIAETVAENVFGVSDVQNSIRVKREEFGSREQRVGRGAGRDDDSAYSPTDRRGERDVNRAGERDTKSGESRTSTDGHDKSRKGTG